LWVALALLLVVGGVMGEMPRWAAVLAVIVHPLSGVGAFVAIDSLTMPTTTKAKSPFSQRRFSLRWSEPSAWRTSLLACCAVT